ncbi:MAG: hypothetical protein OXU22_06035 [Gammaproteobacteria bacterium]|nr:hypothetical protein [Gammaproteobacteria bacterium]
MAEYKKIDEKVWQDFGKSILAEKGSEKQREFLDACRAGKDDFLRYVRDIYAVDNNVIGEQDVGFKHRFSKGEFRHVPKDTQQVIWNAFKDIPVDDVSSCGFWGHVVITMIDDGLIEPEFLASGLNGDTDTGSYVIDKALQSNDKKQIDGCARRILRSLCNPAPRGKRIVFDDFYLGRSFWRWCWSERMSTIIKLQRDEILKILDENYYAPFSAKMHTGRSYISAENILGGLLLYLKGVNKKKVGGKRLGKIIDSISRLSAWKAIEIQSPSLNKKEIQTISKILKGKSRN